jgi:hypothetical protein
MVMPVAEVAVCEGIAESVTLAKNVERPAVVGTPLITPEVVFKVRPAGREPEVMLQV